jgi:hypothetical protein
LAAALAFDRLRQAQVRQIEVTAQKSQVKGASFGGQA